MTPEQERDIHRHGENLQRIFPATAGLDPVALCKKLRRLERKGAAFALRSCNGPAWPTEEGMEKDEAAILAAVDRVLGFQAEGVPVFLNHDPRGYALKIASEWAEERAPFLHRDWGDYGIIAPELGPEGLK